MDLGLSGRVALVVGGNGYIGSAVAARLREEGATVVVGSRSGDGDLTIDGADDGSVDAAVAQLIAEHGRLEVVVITAAPSAQTLDPDTLDQPAAVADGIAGKSLTFLRIANAVLPGMRDAGFGRVVGISGQNAYLTGNILGSARNAVLNIAAKNLADAYAGTGVTVNTVNPGPVADEPGSDVAKGVPGESSPDQIAALVAFLSSDLAAAVSGEAVATGHKLRGSAVI